LDLAVSPERILQESFGGSAANRREPSTTAEFGTTIEFVRSQRTATVHDGRSVLEVAEEYGVTIPSVCRQGQCGTCRTRVLEGRVRMDTEQGLDAESKAQGFVLTCVGHPDGDITLEA
jgi:ferredoxin